MVLAHPEVGDDEHEIRVASQQLGDRPRPGVLAGPRVGADVGDDGHRGVLEDAPRVVEQRVERAEHPDLDVHLEQPHAASQRVADVGRRGRLGKNVPAWTASGTRAANSAHQSLSHRARCGRWA